MRKNLAWLGVVLFAVSWFVNAHKMQGMSVGFGELAEGFSELTEGLAKELGGPAPSAPSGPGPAPAVLDYGGPPGWQACRFAFDMLIDKEGMGFKGSKTERILLGATSLTNIVMLLAVLTLFLRMNGIPKGLGVLLLLCAALNLGWLYHSDADVRDQLAVGYYLWTGSFLLVGLASLMASPD